MTCQPTSTQEHMKSDKMSPCYIKKKVGPMDFYSCQACPFMAMAEIDVKSHLFISHPDLVKTISFLKDVRLQCPGCGDIFDSEASIKMHIRIHHKMGLRDVKKLLKTLITVALKNTSQETAASAKESIIHPPALDKGPPLVIEIRPDTPTKGALPSGISVISLGELQKLKTINTPNEQDDPKKIIEEACMNIVYIDERIEGYSYPSTEHIVKTPEILSYNSPTTVTSQTYCNTSTVPHIIVPNTKKITNKENTQNSSAGQINFSQSKHHKINNVIAAQPETNDNIEVQCVSNKSMIRPEFKMKGARSVKPNLKSIVESKSDINIHNSVEVKCELKKSESKRQSKTPKKSKIKSFSSNCNKKTIEEYSSLDNKKENANQKTSAKETPSIETETSDVKKLECSYKACEVSLDSPENMKYHSMCHQDNALRCPECKQRFYYTATLHQHLWKCHNIDMNLHTCDKCGYKTVSKHRLEKVHKRIHTTIRTYKCPTCSKVFKSSKQLSYHKTTHIDTTLSCEKCKREFKTGIVLRRHIQVVHENVKPYRCDLCPYSSSTNNDLRIHLRVHSGETPFGCDECPFKAADPKSLRRHQKVHSRNYKYNCKYCNYRCIQTSSLKKHILGKHGDVEDERTVLSCPFCVHTSINRATFVTHLSKHIDLREKKAEDQTILESNVEPKSVQNDAVPTQAEEHSNKTFEDFNEMTEEDSSTANVLIELEDNDTCHEVVNTCNTPLNDFTNEHLDLFSDSFFNMTPLTTDLTQDDNISECIVSESSNDTILEMMDPVQSIPRSLPIFLSNNSINLKQGLPIRMVANAQNNAQMINSFPIRLPMNSQSVSNGNFRLTPFDKIPLPGSKVYGSQIRTAQMFTIPTHGTGNRNNDLESIPRKKPKISVKSNLILKGPDKVNMFRLEDNEDHIDSTHHTPITLNNLINRQLMQLNPDSALVNSQGTRLLQNMLPYADTMLNSGGTPQGDCTPNTPQLFNFSPQEIDTTDLNMISHQMQTANLVQCNNNANYIKLEAQQSFQPRTHSLNMFPDNSRLCGSDLLQDYCKTSPPLDEIHKNDNEIKNEMKTDVFLNLQTHKMQNDSVRNSPTINDSSLMNDVITSNELYGGRINLMVLPNMIEPGARAEIIELEDKKQNNYSMNYQMDSMNGYYLNNDFQLESDLSPINPVYTQPGNISDFDVYTRDSSRVLTDLNPLSYDQNRIDMSYTQPTAVSIVNNEFSMDNYVLERRDPMMNTTVRPTMTKINVKNIELMKNSDFREQH